MSDEDPSPNAVLGERDASTASRALSMQSRVSNALAIGLMSVLGLGALTWYYAHMLTQQDRARGSAQAASTGRAQGDLPLPSLGRIVPPMPAEPAAPLNSPVVTTLAEAPLVESSAYPTNGAPAAKSAAQLELERRLSGSVFGQTAAVAPGSASAAAGWSAPGAGAGESDAGELAARLHPGATPAVKALLLPAQRLLLPKGAFIDCTLETAIDSTLPGMTTCVTATDTFGVDGKVVLMERGTKMIGETRGQVQQGSARVFVLWSEARTPAGVVVPLASPGADELGRSGLPGEVNRHFWQRFGAAILVSVIDGAVEAAAQSSRSGSGTVILNPSASQDMVTEVLKGTINIPPAVVKHNGDRIQVLVARDLDFRPVYELRSTARR